MRWRLVTLLLGALCAFPAAVRADSFDPVSFGVQLSTLGYGITLERPLLFDLSARIATGTLSYSRAQTFSGTTPWEGTLQENNVLVAADWRPYGGRWRLSGGLLFGSDQIQYAAQSSGGSYVLNNHAYAAAGAGAVGGTVSFARPEVYIGLGGGTGLFKGFTLAFDAGVVMRSGTSTTFATGPLQTNAAFQSDLATTAAQFRTRWIQPVIGVGLTFRP
jgi:hypothetical protein